MSAVIEGCYPVAPVAQLGPRAPAAPPLLYQRDPSIRVDHKVQISCGSVQSTQWLITEYKNSKQ